jgi:hypothetical protein
MNKTVLFTLSVLTLILSACSGASNAGARVAEAQGGRAGGELSMPMLVAIGTIKLDGTGNDVTAEQAKQLLPLWETLQVLDASDTAATEEKDALLTQIQETMTPEQTQAITGLNLTRQDMFSIMQSQGGLTFGGPQNGTTQNGSSSNNNRRNASGNGGFFIGGGGPPPDGGGGFAGGGNPNFQRQAQGTQSNATGTSNRPTTVDPNRIPTQLVQAVIEYLKTKAGA